MSNPPHSVSLDNSWTGGSLGVHEGANRVPALVPHTALLLKTTGTANE